MTNDFIIANISWNRHNWQQPFINPKAGHKYAQNFAGHESLNFDFNKINIDTPTDVFGYIRWTNKPKKFRNGGLIILYSKNTDENKVQIIGVYGEARILDSEKGHPKKGFQNNNYWTNVYAKRNLSLLFPKPLDAKKYSPNKRLVPQVGYTYIEQELAEEIILDEIRELSSSGIQENEFKKLKDIYEYYFHKPISDFESIDIKEQNELTKYYINKPADVANDLENYTTGAPKEVIINHKIYKRDNKIIAQLKINRGFKCQICETKIKKANGTFYIEAAHISPKHKKGNESPDNILILCPNHHKEFDYGKRIIKNHSKDIVEFALNNIQYRISLTINKA